MGLKNGEQAMSFYVAYGALFGISISFYAGRVPAVSGINPTKHGKSGLFYRVRKCHNCT